MSCSMASMQASEVRGMRPLALSQRLSLLLSLGVDGSLWLHRQVCGGVLLPLHQLPASAPCESISAAALELLDAFIVVRIAGEGCDVDFIGAEGTLLSSVRLDAMHILSWDCFQNRLELLLGCGNGKLLSMSIRRKTSRSDPSSAAVRPRVQLYSRLSLIPSPGDALECVRVQEAMQTALILAGGGVHCVDADSLQILWTLPPLTFRGRPTVLFADHMSGHLLVLCETMACECALELWQIPIDFNMSGVGVFFRALLPLSSAPLAALVETADPSRGLLVTVLMSDGVLDVWRLEDSGLRMHVSVRTGLERGGEQGREQGGELSSAGRALTAICMSLARPDPETPSASLALLVLSGHSLLSLQLLDAHCPLRDLLLAPLPSPPDQHQGQKQGQDVLARFAPSVGLDAISDDIPALLGESLLPLDPYAVPPTLNPSVLCALAIDKDKRLFISLSPTALVWQQGEWGTPTRHFKYLTRHGLTTSPQPLHLHSVLIIPVLVVCAPSGRLALACTSNELFFVDVDNDVVLNLCAPLSDRVTAGAVTDVVYSPNHSHSPSQSNSQGGRQTSIAVFGDCEGHAFFFLSDGQTVSSGRFLCHKGSVACVLFSGPLSLPSMPTLATAMPTLASNSFLLTASLAGEVKIWRPKLTLPCDLVFELIGMVSASPSSYRPSCAAVDPMGRLLLGLASGALTVWSLPLEGYPEDKARLGGELLGSHSAHTGPVNECRLWNERGGATDSLLSTTSDDMSAVLWTIVCDGRSCTLPVPLRRFAFSSIPRCATVFTIHDKQLMELVLAGEVVTLTLLNDDSCVLDTFSLLPSPVVIRESSLLVPVVVEVLRPLLLSAALVRTNIQEQHGFRSWEYADYLFNLRVSDEWTGSVYRYREWQRDRSVREDRGNTAIGAIGAIGVLAIGSSEEPDHTIRTRGRFLAYAEESEAEVDMDDSVQSWAGMRAGARLEAQNRRRQRRDDQLAERRRGYEKEHVAECVYVSQTTGLRRDQPKTARLRRDVSQTSHTVYEDRLRASLDRVIVGGSKSGAAAQRHLEKLRGVYFEASITGAQRNKLMLFEERVTTSGSASGRAPEIAQDTEDVLEGDNDHARRGSGGVTVRVPPLSTPAPPPVTAGGESVVVVLDIAKVDQFAIEVRIAVPTGVFVVYVALVAAGLTVTGADMRDPLFNRGLLRTVQVPRPASKQKTSRRSEMVVSFTGLTSDSEYHAFGCAETADSFSSDEQIALSKLTCRTLVELLDIEWSVLSDVMADVELAAASKDKDVQRLARLAGIRVPDVSLIGVASKGKEANLVEGFRVWWAGGGKTSSGLTCHRHDFLFRESVFLLMSGDARRGMLEGAVTEEEMDRLVRCFDSQMTTRAMAKRLLVFNEKHLPFSPAEFAACFPTASAVEEKEEEEVEVDEELFRAYLRLRSVLKGGEQAKLHERSEEISLAKRTEVLSARLALLQRCEEQVLSLVHAYKAYLSKNLCPQDLTTRRVLLSDEDIGLIMAAAKFLQLCSDNGHIAAPGIPIGVSRVELLTRQELTGLYTFSLPCSIMLFTPDEAPRAIVRTLPGTHRRPVKPWHMCSARERLLEASLACMLGYVLDLAVKAGIAVPDCEDAMLETGHCRVRSVRFATFMRWYAGDEESCDVPGEGLPSLARVLLAERLERPLVDRDFSVAEALYALPQFHSLQARVESSEEKEHTSSGEEEEPEEDAYEEVIATYKRQRTFRDAYVFSELVKAYETAVFSSSGAAIRADLLARQLGFIEASRRVDMCKLLWPPVNSNRLCQHFMFPRAGLLLPKFELPPKRFKLFPSRTIESWTLAEIEGWYITDKVDSDDAVMVRQQRAGEAQESYLLWQLKHDDRLKEGRSMMIEEDKRSWMMRHCTLVEEASIIGLRDFGRRQPNVMDFHDMFYSRWDAQWSNGSGLDNGDELVDFQSKLAAEAEAQRKKAEDIREWLRAEARSRDALEMARAHEEEQLRIMVEEADYRARLRLHFASLKESRREEALMKTRIAAELEYARVCAAELEHAEREEQSRIVEANKRFSEECAAMAAEEERQRALERCEREVLQMEHEDILGYLVQCEEREMAMRMEQVRLECCEMYTPFEPFVFEDRRAYLLSERLTGDGVLMDKDREWEGRNEELSDRLQATRERDMQRAITDRQQSTVASLLALVNGDVNRYALGAQRSSSVSRSMQNEYMRRLEEVSHAVVQLGHLPLGLANEYDQFYLEACRPGIRDPDAPLPMYADLTSLTKTRVALSPIRSIKTSVRPRLRERKDGAKTKLLVPLGVRGAAKAMSSKKVPKLPEASVPLTDDSTTA